LRCISAELIKVRAETQRRQPVDGAEKGDSPGQQHWPRRIGAAAGTVLPEREVLYSSRDETYGLITAATFVGVGKPESESSLCCASLVADPAAAVAVRTRDVSKEDEAAGVGGACGAAVVVVGRWSEYTVAAVATKQTKRHARATVAVRERLRRLRRWRIPVWVCTGSREGVGSLERSHRASVLTFDVDRGSQSGIRRRRDLCDGAEAMRGLPSRRRRPHRLGRRYCPGIPHRHRRDDRLWT